MKKDGEVQPAGRYENTTSAFSIVPRAIKLPKKLKSYDGAVPDVDGVVGSEILPCRIRASSWSSPSTKTTAIPDCITNCKRLPANGESKERELTDHNMPLDMAMKNPCARVISDIAIPWLATRLDNFCLQIGLKPTELLAIPMVANSRYPCTEGRRG